MNRPEDPFKKRYLYKLFSNFINFLFSLISQSIIPRGLGPEAYGSFSFLTNFFTQMTGFMDAGTSTYFYTRLSRRPKDQGLVSFYFIFAGVIFALIALFVAITVTAAIYPVLWPNQGIPFIYLAFGLGFLMWFAQVINSMTDAYGLTVPAEILKTLQRFVAVLILLGLFVTHRLDLKNFFFYNYVIWLIFAVLLIGLIVKSGNLIKERLKIFAGEIKGYARELWRYSHPLFAYSLVVLVGGIFDRWLLQVYGGSVQQGFYSLSYQIGIICFLFTGAMTPLFMRELSIAHENKDLDKMKRMFRRYMPILYAITAYFSCFIAVEADKVVYIFGGNRFNGAIIAVAIMAFYPIHQTFGQLSSSVFYATAQTKLYRNIGIIIILAGLPVTYFLIAPSERMGINAGAAGLAAKMVALNIIGVNVQLYFNAKQLRFNYWRYLGHQIMVVGIFIVFAIGADLVVNFLLKSGGKMTIFFASGVLYSALAMIAVYLFPVILGLHHNDINAFIHIGGRK